MNAFCRYTSSAPAAIAVVELSGAQASQWLNDHWQPGSGNSRLTINHIRYGTLSDAQSQSGESVVVCRTGVDRFEIHCHGGQAAANRIEIALDQAGFAKQSPMGFHHEPSLDRLQQQAIEDLQNSVSFATTAILMDQYHGALTREIQTVVSNLDRPELAMKSIQSLLDLGDLGAHLIQPWKIVLAGPPNAGKSSLLNAILGYQRAIVHATAGTTRDLLSEQTSIEGWPVTIVDSAGVRSSADEVESLGIQASLNAVATADCVLLLVAPETGWTNEHEKIRALAQNARVLVVETKKDLRQVTQNASLGKTVETSVTDVDSIQRLLEAIASSLVPRIPPVGQGLPFRAVHRASLAQAQELISIGNKHEAKRVLESLLA